MFTKIELEMEISRLSFLHGAWPRLHEEFFCGTGSIVQVEGHEKAKFLDVFSGIDYWHVCEKGGVRGIANRCQWPKVDHLPKTWEAFTLRIGNLAIEDTELAKRLHALENREKGVLMPHYFVQSFFKPHDLYDELRKSVREKTVNGVLEKLPGAMICSGIARLADILKVIIDGKKVEKFSFRYSDGDWYEDVTSEEWGSYDAKRFAVIPWATLVKWKLPFKMIMPKPPPTPPPQPITKPREIKNLFGDAW
jgi:hypothetical protein